MSQGRYEARRATVLVLLVGTLLVLAAGLVFFDDTGDNPKRGARVEAPNTPSHQKTLV
jgi:hypothetical protein